MNKIYKSNKKGRDFIIGDLHGCFSIFEETLKKINFDKTKDRMFSVGDLIDRGSDSLKCLYLIHEDWFHATLGNHEDMFINTIVNGESSDCWDNNGGMWHYGENKIELELLGEDVSKLPHSITIKSENSTIGICHAQPPSLDWTDAESEDERYKTVMLWARSWIADKQMENVTGVDITFHGHTPIDKVLNIGNVNFIDTGAVFTGNLTCVEIDK